MKQVVRKAFFNFEKEEKWLNEMAAKGLNLVDYSFARYVFEEGLPGEYIYRIELLKELPRHPESKAYIKFMEETGVECVSTYTRWAFFRKKASDGPFDLYSDIDSRISHYKRVVLLVGGVALANLFIGLSNLSIGLLSGETGHGYRNAYFSIFSFGVVALFTPLIVSFVRKIRRLKREKAVYE